MLNSTQQTALTSPSDRDPSNTYRPTLNEPALSGQDFDNSVNDLSDSNFIKKYPRVERTFADPSVPGQTYCLVSFVPSTKATPDPDGIYGMIKVRGSYDTLHELNSRAEFLIGNIDSYHKIYHAWVGKPFPATSSSKFSAQSSEVDIKTKVTKIISEDIKKQKLKEKEEIDDIKEREKNLIEESEKGIDPYEHYTTQRVKKAQLVWTYLETQKKMVSMKESIIKTRAEIAQLDEENPDYIEQYQEKFYEARRKSGIKDDNDSFIQYMGENPEELERLGF